MKLWDKSWVRALGYSIWLFAGLHLLLLFFRAVFSLQPELLNIFGILDLQAFWPGIEQGGLSAVLSVVVIAAVYLYFWHLAKRK